MSRSESKSPIGNHRIKWNRFCAFGSSFSRKANEVRIVNILGFRTFAFSISFIKSLISFSLNSGMTCSIYPGFLPTASKISYSYPKSVISCPFSFGIRVFTTFKAASGSRGWREILSTALSVGGLSVMMMNFGDVVCVNISCKRYSNFYYFYCIRSFALSIITHIYSLSIWKNNSLFVSL